MRGSGSVGAVSARWDFSESEMVLDGGRVSGFMPRARSVETGSGIETGVKGDCDSAVEADRGSCSEALILAVWSLFESAEVSVSGSTSALGFDSVGVKGAAVAFNSFLSESMLVVHRFLNEVSSSGLTNGTESLFRSSPYKIMTFCESKISAL